MSPCRPDGLIANGNDSGSISRNESSSVKSSLIVKIISPGEKSVISTSSSTEIVTVCAWLQFVASNSSRSSLSTMNSRLSTETSIMTSSVGACLSETLNTFCPCSLTTLNGPGRGSRPARGPIPSVEKSSPCRAAIPPVPDCLRI